MSDDTEVKCTMCEKEVDIDKSCIGFGIEEPISQSHYFCSEECRSEYIISETAAKKGVNYKIRPILCNGTTMKYSEGISEEMFKKLEDGEVIKCLEDDESFAMAIYMDPFGEVKEF